MPQEEPRVPSNPIEAARGAQVAARYAEAGGGRLQQEIEAGQRRAAQFQERPPQGGDGRGGRHAAPLCGAGLRPAVDDRTTCAC
jgi:hypothetical protein